MADLEKKTKWYPRCPPDGTTTCIRIRPRNPTDIQTIGQLVDMALNGMVPNAAGRKVGRFTVIVGGTH